MRLCARNFPTCSNKVFAYGAAARLLRQEAIDGRLIVKGRPENRRDQLALRGSGFSFSQVWQIIPHEYWRKHEIDVKEALLEQPIENAGAIIPH